MLNDRLDDLFGGTPADPISPEALDKAAASALASMSAKPAYIEPCRACAGSGRFTRGRFMGRCYACRGTGRKTFATPPAAPAAAAAKRAESGPAAWKAFAEDQPTRAAWIDANPGFDFAQSLKAAVMRFGGLTANQAAAIDRLIARDEARKAAMAQRKAEAAPIDVNKIEVAFGVASSRLKKPKLRLPGGFEVSKAGIRSRNPGALYVCQGEEYLGKIMGGVFERSAKCSPETEAAFRAHMDDPLAAAVEFGRVTGQCACCGKTLTNPESIERGIGPICASSFGW